MRSASRMPWQKCLGCGKTKRAADDLCRTCWRAAPAAAKREHYRTLGRFKAGYVHVDRVQVSTQTLARAAREGRFGLELFA